MVGINEATMILDWLKNPRVLKIGRIVGYITFGIVVFMIAIVVTFPNAKLRSYLENRLSVNGQIVRISDLSLRGLASARIYGLQLDLVPAKFVRPDGLTELVTRRVALDQVDVSLSLFKLLVGKMAVTVTVKDGGGVLGPLEITRFGGRVLVAVDNIRDFPVPDELPLFGVKFQGVLNEGRIRLDYDEASGLVGSEGDFELKGSGLRAVAPVLRSKTQGNVALSDVNLGGLILEVHLGKRQNMIGFKSDRRSPLADETIIHLARAELDGTDVKILIEGQSTIRLSQGRSLAESMMNIEAAFSLADVFLDRKVTVNEEVRTPNSFLRTLLSMDPKWKNAKSGNYWGIVCSGMLSSPSCNPKKPAIRGGDFKAPVEQEVKTPEVEEESEQPVQARSAARARPDRPERAQPVPREGQPVQPAVTPGPAPLVPNPNYTPPPRREAPAAQVEPVVDPVVVPEPPAAPEPAVQEEEPSGLRPMVIGRARFRAPTQEEPAQEAPQEQVGNETGEE